MFARASLQVALEEARLQRRLAQALGVCQTKQHKEIGDDGEGANEPVALENSAQKM